MMNRTFLLSLLGLALTLGSTLQALTTDELYNHARKAVRLLPEAEIKIHPYKKQTREQYLAALKLTADDEAKLSDYLHGTEVVEKELSASALQRWAPRIIGLFVGGFIGSKTFKSVADKYFNNIALVPAYTAATLLTNHAIAVIANAIQRNTLGAKINTLHRTTIELLIVDDTPAYKAKLATLRVLVILQRFVRSLLLGGALYPAARFVH